MIGLGCMALLWACSSNKEDTEQKEKKESSEVKEKTAEVEAQLLKPGDFNYELISNGAIIARQKADLKFQSTEIIRKIYVRNGARVNKGDKLAELDLFKLSHALSQSKEALERARLDLQDVLIGQGYTIDRMDQVPEEVMRLAKLRSNFEQAENNHAMAEYNYHNATLYAPFSGVVANLDNKEFNAPTSEAFCTIIDDRQPEVVFHILENELPLIRQNDKVVISPFSNPALQVEGSVCEINPVIDKNGMVKVKATAGNRDGKLFEGMNVKVRVQRLLGERLVIPKSALVLRNNKKVVFTLKEGQAVWNYVQTAQENTFGYVVTEGLTAGDSVIYEGNLTLAHEARVRLRVKN